MAVRKQKIRKVCPKCSTEFFVKPSLIRVVCCSLRCARLGVPASEKQKEAARKHALGNTYSKGRIPWNKGLRGFLAGVQHYNWIADRTMVKTTDREHNDPRYKQWKKEIHTRDKAKCRIANEDCSGRLEAHHILPWSESPELRYEVNNGISLCHYHHPRKRKEEQRLAPVFQQMVLSPAYELALSK